MQLRARAVLDRIADERELHGPALRQHQALEESEEARERQILRFDRFGENRVETAEFSAEHVGEQLIADDGDLAAPHAQHSHRAQKAERQRLERVGNARDVQLRGDRRNARSEKLFESITIRKPRSWARATHSRCSCASSVSRKPSSVLSRSTIRPRMPAASSSSCGRREAAERSGRAEHWPWVAPVIPGILEHLHTRLHRQRARPLNHPPIFAANHKRPTRSCENDPNILWYPLGMAQ